ncbi:MAG: tetratricopeptide repeat protein [Methylobacter sp.]|nr:tetratricopeptide repeat protein [Methylobacter sp.]MDP2427142.1 tetratricopeptide repeat protein [Methylobacter sp.]MDP3361102.1 tetratricopeptide repeat protein [Methylobacter sp.]MDZ4218012.1 tetratricopeptide repeat protein [Methylobacter sp.]
MQTISIQAVTTLTGWSLRTIRRRLADGTLSCVNNEDRIKTMISFDSIKNDIGIPLKSEDIELIMSADTGDANAQNDLALLFLENNKPQSAIYWLELAAKQGFADAMQLLGKCYLKGNGVDKDNNIAMMWVAKAASLGHPIALAQMKSIRLLSDDEIENRVD